MLFTRVALEVCWSLASNISGDTPIIGESQVLIILPPTENMGTEKAHFKDQP